MWNAEIKNGTLYLDGKEVPYVTKFAIENENNYAILTASIAVTIKGEIVLPTQQHLKLSVSKEI